VPTPASVGGAKSLNCGGVSEARTSTWNVSPAVPPWPSCTVTVIVGTVLAWSGVGVQINASVAGSGTMPVGPVAPASRTGFSRNSGFANWDDPSDYSSDMRNCKCAIGLVPKAEFRER
jgi:hypothetical protein